MAPALLLLLSQTVPDADPFARPVRVHATAPGWATFLFEGTNRTLQLPEGITTRVRPPSAYEDRFFFRLRDLLSERQDLNVYVTVGERKEGVAFDPVAVAADQREWIGQGLDPKQATQRAIVRHFGGQRGVVVTGTYPAPPYGQQRTYLAAWPQGSYVWDVRVTGHVDSPALKSAFERIIGSFAPR